MAGNVITNPAAVVTTVGGRANGSAVQAEPIRENSSRVVSQLSRNRAANGDPRISSETAQAIRNGALPPPVSKLKESNTQTDEIKLTETAQKIFDSLDTFSGETSVSIPTYSDASSQIISTQSQNASSGEQINISI